MILLAGLLDPQPTAEVFGSAVILPKCCVFYHQIKTLHFPAGLLEG